MRNAKFAVANFALRKICQGTFCAWAILGQLGSILGHFGATLGYLGAILGRSWAVLGLLSLYWTSCRSQSRFKKNLYFVEVELCVCVCFLESSYGGCFQSYFWSILGAILGHLEATLEPSWAILGQYWTLSRIGFSHAHVI